MKTTAKLWIGIGILTLLSPLGLIIPAHFKASSGWGEWGVEEIQKLTGYVPKGLATLSSLWPAPLPDYTFQGTREKNLGHLSFSYIISGLVGIIVVVGFAILIGKFLSRKE